MCDVFPDLNALHNFENKFDYRHFFVQLSSTYQLTFPLFSCEGLKPLDIHE